MASDSEVGDLKEVAVGKKDFLRNGNSLLRTATVLSLLVLAQLAWTRWTLATNGPTVDFFTLWSVPQTLHHEPGVNVYSAETQLEMGSTALLQAQSPGASDHQREATTMTRRLYNGRIEATGSPWLYALIGALSSGDFPTDQKRFLFVSMACLVASILFLSRLLRFNTLAIALLFAFILWNYEPFLSDINAGNVNEFQLFGIVLFIFFAARSQPLLAGLTIGATTAFKPITLMVMALSVIVGVADQDYEELLYMLLGCLAGFAASVVGAAAYFRQPTMWLQYLHSLPKTGTGTYAVKLGNFSLTALLFGKGTAWSVSIPIVLLAAFAWLFFSTRRGKHSSTPLPKEANDRLRLDTAFCVGGCGCAVMLLSSPLVWVHYYLLLLPLCLYLVFSEGDQGNPSWGNARRILAFSLPFVPLVLFSLSLVQIVKDARLVCMSMILATILTVALASYRIWERRRVLQPRASRP
jgi:Glycosyltransferase family 87